MGFEVLGDNDSPVMHIMLYNPAKIPAFSRERLKQNVRTSNASQFGYAIYFFHQFCYSCICIFAAHSKEDLIKALELRLNLCQSSERNHLHKSTLQ
ncbi:hypothetical protein K1719_011925 [Acacia pycnantha]|nr:hypothetical protein K1719_011925 [Acacia pycnantha]